MQRLNEGHIYRARHFKNIHLRLPQSLVNRAEDTEEFEFCVSDPVRSHRKGKPYLSRNACVRNSLEPPNSWPITT